jgi:hypothetical protein
MNGRRFASKRGRILYRARSERHARRAIARLAREAGAQPIYAGGKLVAHVFPDGFVVCEKRRYRDQAAALAELAGTRAFAHLHDHKLPVRVYPCPHCMGWHATSRA